MPAVAEHDDAIRDLLHFFEEVRDIDDRQPARLQAADQPEQPLHVVVAQAARRLIEDQDMIAVVQTDADDLARACDRGTEPGPLRQERRARGVRPLPRVQAGKAAVAKEPLVVVGAERRCVDTGAVVELQAGVFAAW